MEDQEKKNVRVREDAKTSGITISRAHSILSCLTSTSYPTPSLRFLETAGRWLSVHWSVGLVPKPIFYSILFLHFHSVERNGAKVKQASERTNDDDTPLKYPTCHFSFFIFLNPFLAAWRFYIFTEGKGYLDSHLSTVVSVYLRIEEMG